MVTIPKRNRSKDNPYILDFDENKKTYIVKFKDNNQVLHIIEITEEIYRAFDKFELEDVSQNHKYRKHIERSEMFEETINNRAFHKPKSIESKVEEMIINQELKDAVNLLSEKQKKRIKMYYFEDMNLREIAEKERCSIMSVKNSIDSGLYKLKEILKN